MNNDRRKAIAKIVAEINALDLGTLKSLGEDLGNLRDEEQEAFNNMPESLQQSDRGQDMETAIDAMNDVIDRINEAHEALTELQNEVGRLEDL